MGSNNPAGTHRNPWNSGESERGGLPNRAGVPPLAGFIVIDKPEGKSSMAAVAAVRRRAGGIKCGHAGTLDPLATGVLIVGVGRPATRHLGSIMRSDKRYETQIDLSCFTTTDDREGEQIACGIGERADERRIQEVLRSFVGEIEQTPPAFSAIKVRGRRAYRKARQGVAVDLPPRRVRCDTIDVISFDWPLLRLDVRCGKGFYIRALARDLGRALDTGGHCRSIRRMAVGAFAIDEAIPLDELPECLEPRDLLDVETALERLR